MTSIRLNSDEAARLLVAHLHEQADLAVELVREREVRVNVLGSYGAEGMRLEVLLRLRAWQAAELALGHDVWFEFEDD